MNVYAKDTAEALKQLTHYEIDKSFILDHAIRNLEHTETKVRLSAFKAESENIIRELCDLIEELGEKPPSHEKDFKGYFMQGYAVMRGLASDHGTLQALDTNQKLVLDAYKKTLQQKSIEEAIRSNIQKLQKQNEELYDYISQQIKILK